MSTKEQNKTYNSNITKEDKKALRDRIENIRSDQGDDTQLKGREENTDFAGSDLDVPGRTLPKNKSPKNLKDEENQLYSESQEQTENTN
ncbi:hypothetical protein [uncultured Kriegella sp.]|uniref:hypothetical protein n=1 Tax=uncultured Kriegella sp. TaxID=1798910 RepID=UPI0030D8EF75|tara:strand:- start:394043 stop:394309 length:267 start_codon:yes stop_codon:yes gene_type:complete